MINKLLYINLKRFINKTTFNIPCLLIFLLTIYPNYSFSAENNNSEDVVDLGTIVVTATKYPQPINQVPSTVTVINEEEIQEQNVTNVGELLYEVPGVNVTSLGLPGEDFDIRIRGTDRDDVLVFIDGIKLNNPSNDRTQLSLIPTDNIERIEVLRGSQSTLYGSDAVGGVIQIFTKKGYKKTHNIMLDFKGGNLETFRETLAANGGWNKFKYALNYSRIDQKGARSHSRFGENALSGNIEFKFSNNTTLSLFGNYWQSSQEMPTEFLIAPGVVVATDAAPATTYIFISKDHNRKFDKWNTADKISLRQEFTSWWEALLSYSFTYFNDKELNSNKTDTGPTTPLGTTLSPNSVLNKIRSYRHDVNLQQDFYPIDSKLFTDIVTFGLEFEYEDVNISGENYPGDTPPPDDAIGPIPPNTAFPVTGQPSDRQNYALYLQNNFSFDKTLVVNTGFRIDHNTTSDTELSPRVALSYLINRTSTKFKGSYSEGFHAPTVVDFYMARAFGLNSNLKAETSQSYEIGIEQNFFNKKFSSEITYYYIDFDNLIESFQNVGDAYSTGVEVSLTITPINQFQFGGNYTYTKAIDESNGDVPLPNRPRHKFYAFILVKPLPRFVIYLDLNAVGPSYEQFSLVNENVVPITGSYANAADPLKRKNDSYIVANFSMSYALFEKAPYKHFKQLRLHTRVNNITNANYQERYGFPSPGINFLLGATATF